MHIHGNNIASNSDEKNGIIFLINDLTVISPRYLTCLLTNYIAFLYSIHLFKLNIFFSDLVKRSKLIKYK